MKHTLFILFSFFTILACGEDIPKTPKYGKVSMEEMTASYCPIDSTAHAYYFFRKG